MDVATIIFQRVVYTEALITDSWKKYFSILVDAGITSIADFLATPDETWTDLAIPLAPKNRLKLLKQRLVDMQKQTKNSFSQPLLQNAFFDKFEFVPQFMCEQYFSDALINDIAKQLIDATSTVAHAGHDGLTEHQAIMIALYCQDTRDQTVPFYSFVNKCLRDRKQDLIGLRPAVYLLDSALRALPKIKAITWRGMNVAPDDRKFVVDQEVCFAGICSTSLDKSETLQFMERPLRTGETKRTLFKLHMNAGVSVQKWSFMSNESEVVAPFCSRWKVLSNETDRDETFVGIGDYHCDHIIELEQVEGEELFRKNDSPTGLYLLSKLNFETPLEKLRKNFKNKFSDFFNRLTDPAAKSILETFLADDWDKNAKTFQATSGSHEIVFENLTQFLAGVRNLLHEFESQNMDVKHSFSICERHKIYSERQLLWCADGSERTKENLCQLGFSNDCAEKLFEQDNLKKELEIHYKTSKLHLHGTVEDPKNISGWLSDLRFKHCIWRDGSLIGYYDLANLAMNRIKNKSSTVKKFMCRALFSNDIIRVSNDAILTYEIYYSDFIIAGVIFSIQFAASCAQLWHGDITFKQFFKSVSTSAIALASGALATSLGSYFCGVFMMYFGFLGWSVTVGATVGAFVGGLIFGMTFEMLYQKLLETLAPDGESEDFNALRKLYLAALQTLNCTPDSTMIKIKRAYYQLALATHPDKFDNKESATEEFQKLVAAYEIAKAYHQKLEKALDTLDIPKDIGIADLKIWAETHPCSGEKEKAFTIIYRHVAYTSDNMKWLRDKMDSDRQLKLRNSKALSIVTK